MATQSTDRQLSFLYRLAGERVAERYGTCGEERIESVGAIVENERPTRQQVSRWIDWFMAQPKDTANTVDNPRSEDRRSAPDELALGVYRKDGKVYVVKPNRQGTRIYASEVVEIGGRRITEAGEVVNVEFVYAKGMIYQLTAADRLTVEDAERLSIRYGKCICCGHGLKDAKSVARMIGPVCIKKYFAGTAAA